MRDHRDKQHTRNECWIGQTLVRRGEVIPVGLLRCDGPWDLHHLIRRNRLRQELAADVIEAAILDARNLILCCRRHHMHVEAAHVVLFREELPEEVFAFAQDYRMSGWLERYYRLKAT